MIEREQEPDGFRAPCIEALWRPSLLGGIPPWCHWHWAVWFAAGFILASIKPMFCGSLVHGVLLAATYWDHEWPRIVRNLFRNSGELDP